jgi:hypothetical protein
MNNAVTAPALNPPWTCAVVAPTEHAWVLGSAGPKLIMARSTSTLHYDAGYMSELRFSFSTSLDGEEASIYVHNKEEWVLRWTPPSTSDVDVRQTW